MGSKPDIEFGGLHGITEVATGEFGDTPQSVQHRIAVVVQLFRGILGGATAREPRIESCEQTRPLGTGQRQQIAENLTSRDTAGFRVAREQ